MDTFLRFNSTPGTTKTSITWDATPGTYDLAVRVDDGRGGADQQAVQLVVSTVATAEIDGRVGVASVVVNGTDASFLAGRADVTIPPAGESTQDDPAFPLIRNTPVGSLAETIPQAICAAGGEPFSFQVGGVIDYANGAAGGFIGAEGNNALVDDSGAGFTASANGWHPQHGGHGGTDLRAAAAATAGSATATWEFAGLPEGDDDLLTSWQADAQLATGAPSRIYDGDTLILEVPVDQTVAPKQRWGSNRDGGQD